MSLSNSQLHRYCPDEQAGHPAIIKQKDLIGYTIVNQTVKIQIKELIRFLKEFQHDTGFIKLLQQFITITDAYIKAEAYKTKFPQMLVAIQESLRPILDYTDTPQHLLGYFFRQETFEAGDFFCNVNIVKELFYQTVDNNYISQRYFYYDIFNKGRQFSFIQTNYVEKQEQFASLLARLDNAQGNKRQYVLKMMEQYNELRSKYIRLTQLLNEIKYDYLQEVKWSQQTYRNRCEQPQFHQRISYMLTQLHILKQRSLNRQKRYRTRDTTPHSLQWANFHFEYSAIIKKLGQFNNIVALYKKRLVALKQAFSSRIKRYICLWLKKQILVRKVSLSALHKNSDKLTAIIYVDDANTFFSNIITKQTRRFWRSRRLLDHLQRTTKYLLLRQQLFMRKRELQRQFMIQVCILCQITGQICI